ncbi:MAG: dihydrolipoyl dehydrogenase [Peptostreptococcaceae bacterium]|nr:dihydrolipoyl dehydrogenase [Peptostreptococcaceae bacterium]
MAKKITVIGGGPGGYVAAIRAAQLGAEVTLIERDRLGGTCLNRGCIPTKTLFKTAELMHQIKRGEEFAIMGAGAPLVDGEKLYERKQKVVNTLVGGIEQLVKSYPNIRFFSGEANVIDKNNIEVKLSDGATEHVETDEIIIATGSKPEMTETKGVESKGVITSDELLELHEVPKRLIVVGGGVIGLEFASIYQELGSHVILLSSRILKNADKEIGRRLFPLLKKQGIEAYNDIRAKEIRLESDGLHVVAQYKEKDESIEVVGDYVLIASGRGPVYCGLNLEKLGIEHDHSGIVVNDKFETNVKGIYAIGDVVKGNPQLAHVASAQGEAVAEIMMGHQPDINMEMYPNCVFTLNEVSHVGATEEELKAAGVEYTASKFNFAANGKALSLGEGDGMVKILGTPEGKLLGAHILGPHANDLISECTLAIANDMSVKDVLRAIHAHPTLSETVAEATAGIFGQAIHVAPARRKK